MHSLARSPLALGLACGLALAAPLAAQETPRQITVTGSAEIEAVPDRATITAGVTTQAQTAAAALAANSEAMTAVFAALDGCEVAARDMQTSQLNLSPVYERKTSGRRRRRRWWRTRRTIW